MLSTVIGILGGRIGGSRRPHGPALRDRVCDNGAFHSPLSSADHHAVIFDRRRGGWHHCCCVQHAHCRGHFRARRNRRRCLRAIQTVRHGHGHRCRYGSASAGGKLSLFRSPHHGAAHAATRAGGHRDWPRRRFGWRALCTPARVPHLLVSQALVVAASADQRCPLRPARVVHPRCDCWLRV